MSNRQQTGQNAETLACRYLENQGLHLITRNFRCKCGEIDLIMRDKNNLVFTEVRYRVDKGFANSVESISSYKQKKLRNTAHFFLQQHHLTEKTACRFDVVAINVVNEHAELEWIKNAF